MRFLLAGLSVSLLVAGMAMGQEGAPIGEIDFENVIVPDVENHGSHCDDHHNPWPRKSFYKVTKNSKPKTGQDAPRNGTQVFLCQHHCLFLLAHPGQKPSSIPHHQTGGYRQNRCQPQALTHGAADGMPVASSITL